VAARASFIFTVRAGSCKSRDYLLLFFAATNILSNSQLAGTSLSSVLYQVVEFSTMLFF
jgi:hypothetical protein